MRRGAVHGAKSARNGGGKHSKLNGAEPSTVDEAHRVYGKGAKRPRARLVPLVLEGNTPPTGPSPRGTAVEAARVLVDEVTIWRESGTWFGTDGWAAAERVDELHDTSAQEHRVVTMERQGAPLPVYSDHVNAYAHVMERWLGRSVTQRDEQRVASIINSVVTLLIEEEFSTEAGRAKLFTYNMFLLDRSICALQWEGLVDGPQLTRITTVTTGIFCKLVADTPLQSYLLAAWPDTTELDRLERKTLQALDFRVHTPESALRLWFKQNVAGGQ